MNFLRLTLEQRQVVCEDLLAIEHGGLLPRLAALRVRMLRDYRPPNVWQQIDADRLARQASSLVGGTPNYWRDAAAAALGILSPADVCIEAVCRVADDVRWQEESDRREDPRQPAPRARLTIGSRKRGGR